MDKKINVIDKTQQQQQQPLCNKKNVNQANSIQSKKKIETDVNKNNDEEQEDYQLSFKFKVDMVASFLFVISLITRFYKLEEPRFVVFDELHYGKYISLYLKKIFFFDSHPPLGKQLVSLATFFSGFNGHLKFEKIGSAYGEDIPLFTLRFVPAFCGTLLVPVAYHVMLELGFRQWTATVAGLLLVCDNALLTQSRFLLMESILLFFAIFGLLCILKFKKHSLKFHNSSWCFWLTLSFASLTCSLCVKYVGIFSYLLGLWIVAYSCWEMLSNQNISIRSILFYSLGKLFIAIFVSVGVYLLIFYLHLSFLTKAGPHDSVMTSAFQASLEGGLASITKGQPLEVGHGSQITLRHTFGRTCWLHSHVHVYPLRYPDKRGSSHQQQVTCYSFKDVNNWWIVKRPDRNDLRVSEPVDVIRHGDVIQLVHGITSRALNSHDVAAPMSPQNQEVSCYVDYNVSMLPQSLWTVDIVNREQFGDVWLSIQSQVRLIHLNSSQALKFSGRQLPDWGFNQHEIVTDRIINQPDTVWNVEEHRYTKSEDQKERERDLVNAEMIPTKATTLSFWEKMAELQFKMLFSYQEPLQSHMYSSEPIEWPLLKRTTAYWVSHNSNAQIHLLGNILIWYSGVFGVFSYIILLTYYSLRRRRHCFDLPDNEWEKFCKMGNILGVAYFLHYLPYFFMDKTLFLHHYLPALVFKIMLTAAVLEHFHFILRYIAIGSFKMENDSEIFENNNFFLVRLDYLDI
ncbi:protein O-mannosyltransferase, putative [Pediculus humanus corporis]|uniref:Protein O-mannosyltransferase 1 n=1 Tax=Pediculus humanus subsp. corporis TaxID=121224 RepID=E0VJ18_PEDHC|nr:protein O-mannosyltransferase, putative [Pediculus humanus corporis]EEB13374.1 protein O-mannosyltransferase, putative [Pediculus humanus corporis]